MKTIQNWEQFNEGKKDKDEKNEKLKKYVISYYYIKSDHILAVPEYDHEEKIKCANEKELDDYIEKQKDDYGHKFKKDKKKFAGFDYISTLGGVKVKEYTKKDKPKFKTI